MSDQAHRERAAGELDRSFLVEAAAGTGKTTLIVERIAALVLSGVPMQSIVAITFTEKAAGELKLRVRRRLEELVLEGRPGVREALAGVEAAHVSTIHAFCASLIRELPVEAGVDPGFRVMEERERLDLLETLWSRWVAEQLAGDVPAMRRALSLGLGVDWWVRTLQSLAWFLVEHRELVPDGLPQPRDGDPWRELVSSLEQILPELAQLRSACRHAQDRLGTRIDDTLAALQRATEALGGRRAGTARSEGLGQDPHDNMEKLLFERLGVRMGKTGSLGAASKWRSSQDLNAARTALDEVFTALERAAVHVEHNVLAGVLAWLAEFVEVYQARKAERGLLDFDDLLVVARDLLRDRKDVREHVRRRIHTLILDEFQDTDPIQHEIAKLVGTRLFLVGDPKQSIYAFRRADVEMYERARDEMSGPSGPDGKDSSTLQIRRNFRCGPGIVDWVNSVFEHVMVPPAGGGTYQAPYIPLEATREASSSGSGVFVMRPDPHDTAALGDKPKAADRRALEARYVAAFIEHGLERWTVKERDGSERPARRQDVAVLFRAMGDAVAAYEDAFKAAGIRYAIAGGKRLYLRQEVRALRAVCAAVDNPSDGPVLAAALKSPFFAASDAQLFEHQRRYGRLDYMRETDDGDHTVVSRALALLRHWHSQRTLVPPHRLLERIVEDTGVLASLAIKPDGDQRIANVLRLVEEARRIRGSFRTYVRWLGSRVDEAREEGESPVLDPHDPAVRFLTIHKSKGLEFPIVILADPAYDVIDKDPYFVDRTHNRLEFRLGPMKGPGLRTVTYDEAKERAVARSQAEEVRVFYVAATRAKNALVLPVFAQRGGVLSWFQERLPAGGQAYWVTSPGDVFASELGGPARVLDPDTFPRTPEAAPAFRIPTVGLLHALDRAEAEPDREPRRPNQEVVRAAAAPRAVVSVTDLVSGAHDRPVPAAPHPRAVRPAAAAQLGIAVHRGLQLAPLGDAEAASDAARAAAWSLGLAEDHADRAATLAASGAALAVTRAAAGARRVFRELPFTVPIHGTLVEGSIDLAFEAADRSLTVVDYKTDAVAEHELERRARYYELQGALYALALQQVTRRSVRRVVFCFLDSGVERSFPVTPRMLRRAHSAVVDWHEPRGQLSLL